MKQTNILFILLFTFATFSAKTQRLSDSLQAYYSFDGNLLDETINNHDLTLTSGNISYDLANSGDSLVYFNGESTVKTSNFDNSSYVEMSISLWVKTNNVTSNLQICLQGAYMGFGAYIQANTGKFIGFFDGSSSNASVSSSPITDGLWHHIVIQNDGRITYMYVDGVLDASVSDILTVGNGASNNKLYFGKSNLGIQNFTGSLNDTRIYNRLLTLKEIDSLYTGNGPLSIHESVKIKPFNISIYPNPTHNNVIIDLKNQYKKVTVQVFDILGKSVHKESIANSQYVTFNLYGQTGTYLVKVTIEEKIFTYKIIKE